MWVQPYFPVPESEAGAATQYVMRRVAPRRVWPPIAFGASMACWYEHVSRTICLTICRHHRVWDRLFRILTRNRCSLLLLFLVTNCCSAPVLAWLLLSAAPAD